MDFTQWNDAQTDTTRFYTKFASKRSVIGLVLCVRSDCLGLQYGLLDYINVPMFPIVEEVPIRPN